MSLNTLDVDELVRMVDLADSPTELEVALAKKLTNIQNVLVDLVDIIEEEI